MKRYAITVTGEVHGVYFRAHAQQTATQLGLRGFARNEADGSVYIEVEGEMPGLQAFVAWCHIGSPKALVHTVTSSEHTSVGHEGFSIY